MVLSQGLGRKLAKRIGMKKAKVAASKRDYRSTQIIVDGSFVNFKF